MSGKRSAVKEISMGLITATMNLPAAPAIDVV